MHYDKYHQTESILENVSFQESEILKIKNTSTRNQDFQQAKQGKNDEFYTSLEDIELEMIHYTNHFTGKVVYCNCDDPRESNFFRYFYKNFEKLGLKKLITSCYKSLNANSFNSEISEKAVYLEYCGRESYNNYSKDEFVHTKQFEGDGDFRSDESVELLQQADIVVTNPPFSLFKEYCAQLVRYKKKFIIIGNMNAVTYKDIFPLIQNNELWYGPSIRSGDREFRVPSTYPLAASGTRKDEDGNKYVRVKGVRWFTNLDFQSRHRDLPLEKNYSPIKNPRYANYDAIEVSKTKDIPFDFEGQMGVPISFLDQYNPDQFEILGTSRTLSRPMSEIAKKGTYSQGGPRFYLPNGDGTYRRMYERIIIKKKK
ncbi:adenine-specific methyltransferase EcoRI family protein [Mucilaginibacter sp. UR6-1]|uniref:adenine-specific methyltransferase EcoRI family protein n=1 Tax=Mucilaginibacter sp. UR6-1 TaxID=1435643 RepID=UPI001E51729E|nr:adenine-specific methyltransferase EcoRI family protein [Mucilaginibacter sp. UR6-1]MCC8408616.1 adenine-specific methyltransferase EcoRI family protein [Mucilaginibacter sp. UR6-1]